MSVLTAAPLLVAPAAAGPTSLDSSGSAWVFGDWVQFIASAAGDTAIAGFMIGAPPVGSSLEIELQVGIGTAGNEVPLGVMRFVQQNVGNPVGPGVLMLPIPMGGIESGDRVSVRQRMSSTTSVQAIKLLYYVGLDSDQVTTIAQTYACVPSGAAGVTVAANTTDWANSNWVQLTSGLAGSVGIYGVTINQLSGAVDLEIDLGVGAAASEVVITTIRYAVPAALGDLLYCFLPGLYAVGAGVRIAVRIRKSGTDAGNYAATLLYIGDAGTFEGVLSAAGVGANAYIGSVVTTDGVLTSSGASADVDLIGDFDVEEAPVEGVLGITGTSTVAFVGASISDVPIPPVVDEETGALVRFYSDIDMQDPPEWYGGFKQALLQRTGAGERVLSDLVTGDPIGSTFTFRITDPQGAIRRRLSNQTRDVAPANRSGLWVDPLVVRMTTRANRAVLGVPYTVFVGPIIDAQPVRPLAWEVTLGDIVSQRILTDQAVHPWRKIGDGFLDQMSAVSTVLDREMPEPIIYGEHRRVRDVDPPSQHGFEVDLTDHYLGIMEILASDRHVWLVCQGAIADIPDANTVDPQGVHNSIIPEEGTDWLIPHHAGWLGNFGANYYDFRSSTYGNYRRYTLIFGNVGAAEPDACAYASGGFPMAIPPAVPLRLMAFVDGVETVGDGTGEVIWRREEQYLHFMQNYGTRIGASSYQGPTDDNPTGAWLPSPTWSLFTDGERSVIDEASFAALTVIHEIRIPSDGGSPERAGYAGAAIIGSKPGEIHPITKWISDFNRSTFCCSGWTHLGQFRVVTPHPTITAKLTAPLFTDAYEIRQGSFNTEIRWNEHHNRTPYKTDLDHPTGRWMTSNIVDQGDSISNYGREIMGAMLELPFAPGITMSTHIAFLHSWLFKHPPRRVILEDTVGPDANGDSLGYLDLGDWVRYKHYAAVGEPEEERLAWVVRHQVQAGARKVLAELWDMEDSIGFDIPTVFVPLLNDTCGAAVDITNGPDEPYAVTIDTTAHATDLTIIEPPLPFPGIAYHAAWWTYTPPANGSLFLTTVHSRYDTQMAVLTGTCGGDDWVLEQFNDNDGILSTSILEFAVVSGVPLHILVYGYGPDDGGSLTFGLLFTAA